MIDLRPLQELIEDSSVSISSSTNSDVLSQAQVLHLVSDPVLLPVPGAFGFIGLDAADVVGGALHQGLHQTISLFLEGSEHTPENHTWQSCLFHCHFNS